MFYIRTATELDFSVFKSMEGVDTYQNSPCIVYNIDTWMIINSGRKMEEIVNFPFYRPFSTT